MKLFTCTITASNENCVNLPGFSHWGQPRQYGDRIIRTIYFYAKNRTEAAKQLGLYGVASGPCDLSGGQSVKVLPEYIKRLMAK